MPRNKRISSLLSRLLPVACVALGWAQPACTDAPELEEADWTLSGASLYSELVESPLPTATGGLQRFRVRTSDGVSIGDVSVRSKKGLFDVEGESDGASFTLHALAPGVDIITVTTDTEVASFELEVKAPAGLFVAPNMDPRTPVPAEGDFLVFAGGSFVRAYPIDEDGQPLVDESMELTANGEGSRVFISEYWDVHDLAFEPGDNVVTVIGRDDVSATLQGVDAVDRIVPVEPPAQISVGESAVFITEPQLQGTPVFGVHWDISTSEGLFADDLGGGLTPSHSNRIHLDAVAAGEGAITLRIGDVEEMVPITVVEAP